MKLNKLTKGAIALSVLAMLASGALVASAAADTNTTNIAGMANKNHNRGLNKEARIKPENMTEAQKVALEAKKTEMDAKQNAVKTALAANDYNAWVAAEKAINANSPVLSKINADNFSKFVEAHNLRTQADTIMKDLGFDQPGMGGGFGLGMGHGRDGFGPGMNAGAGCNQNNSQK